jgi:hypothetical protein
MWVLLREGVAEREEHSARASVHVVRARARARVCVCMGPLYYVTVVTFCVVGECVNPTIHDVTVQRQGTL